MGKIVIKSNHRDRLVDCLKGYACLLVVFGHVIMGVRKAGGDIPYFSLLVENFIWTFHVPLFMFLSGYVYHLTGEWKQKGSRIKFLKHKLLNLGIPYFFFASIYIMINSFVSGVNNANKISDVFSLWRTPIAQYWFLYALFILFVLWSVLSIFLNNWQITLVLCVVNYILIARGIGVPFLGVGIPHALCFGIGTCISKLMIEQWSVEKKMELVIAHVVLVGIFLYTNISGTMVIEDIEKIIGISASIGLISCVYKNKIFENTFLVINSYSFPIYLLHTIFTAAIRILLSNVGISNYYIHVVLGMIFGLAVPIICAVIANKVPFLEFFIYPSGRIGSWNMGTSSRENVT